MRKAGFSTFSLVPFWMTFGCVAALDESHICYILDAILFVYGLVLTVLYCRMKLQNETANISYPKKEAEERVYEGLGRQDPSEYETIHLKGQGKS
ncbi:high affinity immunoglobulin epsilon receptor subunit gamma [Brachyhypopomus gauderio]|uniref:high affinity immunoglobulin epsilon receptor subunit gamma n=1 Tax=Brachyhypopomus gauderio TaxID=698409 RepID=UPI004041CD10